MFLQKIINWKLLIKLKMQRAIAENMASLLGSAQLSASVQSVSVPAGYSSAGIVLDTQDEIARELDQRMRNLTQQLEDISMDVQMATINYASESTDSNAQQIPKCLLDCQQVASRLDRIGSQVELLRNDIEQKYKNQFYDQLVAQEVYSKLDTLAEKKEDLKSKLNLVLPELKNPAAAAMASQLLELESARFQMISDFNSAQAELLEVTEYQCTHLRHELAQQYKDLATQLRQHYKSKLTALGSRYLTNTDSQTLEQQSILMEASEVLSRLVQLFTELNSQVSQLCDLNEKLGTSMCKTLPATLSRSTKIQLDFDNTQLKNLKSCIQDVLNFKLESSDQIPALSSLLQKCNALLTTLWSPQSDPMARWCYSLQKMLSNPKLTPEANNWLKKTTQLLQPQCEGCAGTVLKEMQDVDQINSDCDHLCRKLASCRLAVDQRKSQTETTRYQLNAMYEADRHKLSTECRRCSDLKLNKLERDQQEAKSRNRILLEERLDQLRQNSNALSYRFSDSTSLTPAKDLAVDFLKQFATLQRTNDEYLRVTTEFEQLRKATQRIEQLKEKLVEVRDLYARTQDVVCVVRPKANSSAGNTTSSSFAIDQPFVFNLTAEIYGIQQVNEESTATGDDAVSANLELKMGTQIRAVTLPINDETADYPVATLNFQKITKASPLIVTIRSTQKVKGYYEMSLENVELNEWVDYQLPENNSNQSTGNTLEPVLRIKMTK